MILCKSEAVCFYLTSVQKKLLRLFSFGPIKRKIIDSNDMSWLVSCSWLWIANEPKILCWEVFFVWFDVNWLYSSIQANFHWGLEKMDYVYYFILTNGKQSPQTQFQLTRDWLLRGINISLTFPWILFGRFLCSACSFKTKANTPEEIQSWIPDEF